ncbi:MAG: large repetitive protein, partial [Frankiales bacterium]|nr:large repetitive protein [Frankiales bacterium]
GGARLLRTTRLRAVRSAAALLLVSSVASAGFVALAVPAHAVAPPPVITSPAATVTSNDRTPAVSFTGGGTQYECAVTSVADPSPTWQSCGSPWPVPSLPADGTYTIAVREQTATNDGDQADVSYTLDTVAGLTVTPPTSPGNDPRPTWQVSVEPGGAATCSLDHGADVPCTGGFTPSSDLTEGDHDLGVTATDGVGNTSPVSTTTYTLDTAAPAATTVTGASGASNDASPTWTWANPEDVTALCTLTSPSGAGSEVACTSKTSFTAAASTEGDYSVSVVLEDAAGNRSPASSGPTYTLDTTPSAAAVFTSEPSGAGTDPSVSWSFTTPGATTTCALVGTSHGTVSSGTCTSPAAYTLPADDSWKLVVSEGDGHGNTVSTDSAAYLLDTTGPDAPVVSAPTGLSNDPAVHVTWAGEMPSTAECRWQRTVAATTTDGPWTACDAAFFDPTLPGDGSYDFQTRLTDLLGNVGAIGTSAGSYGYDGTPPNPPALTTPATPGNDTTPTVTFALETPGGTAACTFYAGTTPPAAPSWTSCAGGSYTPTLPSDGTWTVAVTLSDAAGNTSAPSTFSYGLDTSAPTAVTISGPTGPSNVRTPSWTLTGDPTTTITCRVLLGNPPSGGAVGSSQACTTSFDADLTGQPDGGYTVEVTAADSAHNTTVSTWPYTLDTTAPASPVVSAPTGSGNAAAPSWTFPVQPGSTAQCRLVQGLAMSAWSDCSGGTFTVSNLADGTYTVDVLVADLAGNQAAIASSPPYTSDRTAPAAPAVAGPTGPGNDTAPTWTWTGEAGATATCRLDRAGVVGSPVACNSGTFQPALSGDTSYVVVVQLTDAAGNPGPATSTSPYLLDTVAPAAPTLAAPASPSQSTTPSWGVSAPEGTVECQLASGGALLVDWVACGTRFSTVLTGADGSYTLSARAVDVAGNVSAVTVSGYVLDRTPPGPAVLVAPGSPATGRTPTWTVTGSEPGLSASCSVVGPQGPVTTGTSCTAPTSGSAFSADLTGLPDGTYTLTVQSFDAAGNASVPVTADYVLDSTAPHAVVVTGPITPSSARTATWSLVGDSDSVLECRLQGPTGATPPFATCPGTAQGAGSFTANLATAADGTYVLTVRSRDAADNVGPETSSDYVLDTLAPAAPTAPHTSVSSPSRITQITWTFSGDADTTALCTLTTAAAVVEVEHPCSSPVLTDLSGEPDGDYTLTVRSQDAAGNIGPPSFGDHVLDGTPPAPPLITKTPGSPGPDANPVWDVEKSDVEDTLECQLIGLPASTWASCSDPVSYDLAPATIGTYTLQVRETDPAGNTSGVTSAVTYVYDSSAPATPEVSPPRQSPGNSTTPVFRIARGTGDTDTTSLRCTVTRFDGLPATASPCAFGSSTVTLAGLPRRSEGAVTLTVRGVDAAGNVGGAASATYLYDGRPPGPAAVRLLTDPRGVTPRVTWSFSGPEDVAGFRCTLTRAGTSPALSRSTTCTSPHSALLSQTGTWALTVWALDRAGNASSGTSSSYTFDSPVPAVTDLRTPASGPDSTPTWTFTVPRGYVAECIVASISGAVLAESPCSSGRYTADLSRSPHGQYVLAVQLLDGRGNEGPFTQSRPYRYQSVSSSPGVVGRVPGSGSHRPPTVGSTTPVPRAPRVTPPGGVAPHRTHQPTPAAPSTTRRLADAVTDAVTQPGLLPHLGTEQLGRTLQQVASKPALPLVLVVVVVGFLLVQNRIDRRDPKLASAPVGAEPELDFGPTLGSG